MQFSLDPYEDLDLTEYMLGTARHVNRIDGSVTNTTEICNDHRCVADMMLI